MVPLRPSVRDVLTPSLRREPTPEQESAEDNAALRKAVWVLRHQAGMVLKYGGQEEHPDALELFLAASALDEIRCRHWEVPS